MPTLFNYDFFHGKYFRSKETTGNRGVEIIFKKEIELYDFVIYPRRWEDLDYKGICLYADNKEIACTDTYYSRNTINFKVYYSN